MALRMSLGVRDLERVRLGRLTPLAELTSAAHWSLNDGAPGLHGWARATRARLGDAAPTVLRLVRGPVVQVAGFGLAHDREPSVFDQALDLALSCPSRHWGAVVDDAALLGVRLSRTSIEASLHALEEAALAFHHAAVEPYWPRMQREADAAVASWTEVLRDAGVGALLDQLHPDVSWDGSQLSVEPLTQLGACPPGCPHEASARHISRDRLDVRPAPEGLVVVPSVFGEACVLNGYLRPGPTLYADTLLVPVPVGPGTLLLGPEAGGPEHDALASLLGTTRACVLRVCVEEELSTTRLARRVGISLSSASEHAAVLRAAGLLRFRHDQRATLHAATSLGTSLSRSGSALPRGVTPGEAPKTRVRR